MRLLVGLPIYKYFRLTRIKSTAKTNLQLRRERKATSPNKPELWKKREAQGAAAYRSANRPGSVWRDTFDSVAPRD